MTSKETEREKVTEKHRDKERAALTNNSLIMPVIEEVNKKITMLRYVYQLTRRYDL